MVVNVINPNIQDTEAGRFFKFAASLVYLVKFQASRDCAVKPCLKEGGGSCLSLCNLCVHLLCVHMRVRVCMWICTPMCMSAQAKEGSQEFCSIILYCVLLTQGLSVSLGLAVFQTDLLASNSHPPVSTHPSAGHTQFFI